MLDSSGIKGTTINDLGMGPEEIEKKNFGGSSPGKKKNSEGLPQEINWKAFPWKK